MKESRHLDWDTCTEDAGQCEFHYPLVQRHIYSIFEKQNCACGAKQKWEYSIEK